MEKPKYRAYLCCGPNCGPKGAQRLVDFLAGEVEQRGLENIVSVAATGCQAHCESGPTMVVYPGPTYYQGIDDARLLRIVAEHFVDGEPVTEYFWTGVRRRIIPGAKLSAPHLPMPSRSHRDHTNQPFQAPRQKPRRSVEDVDDFKW